MIFSGFSFPKLTSAFGSAVSGASNSLLGTALDVAIPVMTTSALLSMTNPDPRKPPSLMQRMF